LIREVDEEVDVEIEDIEVLGYQNAVFLDNTAPSGCREHELSENPCKDNSYELGSDHQQIRCVARIKKIKEQTIDPAHGRVLMRKFIKPSEFLHYCPWGKIGERVIEKAKGVWENQFSILK